MPEGSRAIAEAVGPDRDDRVKAARARAERRERIATAVLGHFVSRLTAERAAKDACDLADALIDQLDRRQAEDKGE